MKNPALTIIFKFYLVDRVYTDASHAAGATDKGLGRESDGHTELWT